MNRSLGGKEKAAENLATYVYGPPFPVGVPKVFGVSKLILRVACIGGVADWIAMLDLGP